VVQTATGGEYGLQIYKSFSTKNVYTYVFTKEYNTVQFTRSVQRE